jgi:biofilm PGA synthesis lipoprotein PgaB
LNISAVFWLFLQERFVKIWIGMIVLIVFGFMSTPPAPKSEESLNPGAVYDSSLELYYKNRFQEALEGFSTMIRSFPASKLVSYSQYMTGLCLLRMERFEEAIQQFQLYLKDYPEGDRVREAQTGIRMSEEKLRTKIEDRPAASRPATATGAEKPIRESGKVKRRVCAQIFFFSGKGLEEVELRMKELKEAGVDTVIVKVFQNRGDRMSPFVSPRHQEGVFFKTEFAPVVDDVLGKLADLAHRNGLDLFAWMTTRFANYGSEGVPQYRCRTYNFETKQMEDGKGFTLFHPAVLERLEGLFRDLGRYPIEGILFQDDLILRHNEDFSAEANKAFLREFGFLPHPDRFYVDPYLSQSGKYYVKSYTDSFWTWAKWKNRSLMNTAQRLMSAARESNPRLQFGINLYYEAVLNPTSALGWFSQTLSGALEKGFDYYAVMAYHRQTMKELNLEEDGAIRRMGEVAQKAVQSTGSPSRVLMKVQILDWKSHEVIPRGEVERTLDGILAHGEVSLGFVPYIEQFPLHLLKGKWNKNDDSSLRVRSR